MSNDIAVQMREILDEIDENVKETANRSISEMANESVKRLRANSPKNPKGKNAGRYARGWRSKKGYCEAVIYNSTDWQLTHLLNDGHEKFNRFGGSYGRTNGDGHIDDEAERAGNELPMRISRGLL